MILRWALLLLVPILVIEGVAWATYWILEGTPFSYEQTWLDQADRAATEPLPPDAKVPVDRKIEHVIASAALTLHPFLGFVIDPQRKSRRATESNELGFLGPSPLDPRQPNELRLAIMGGSVAYGLWLEGRETISEMLQETEGCQGRPIQIVSAALGGYKQPQQLAALSYLHAVGVDLDAVVNVDGFNDIVLAPRGQAADAYWMPRNWSTYSNRNLGPKRMRDIGRAQFYRESRERWAAFFNGSAWKRSVLGNLVWHRVDQSLGAKDIAAQEELVRRLAFKNRDPDFRAVGNYKEPADLYTALAALWADASVAMHRLMAGGGGHYFHFLQPNQYDEGSKRLTPRELRRAFQADHPYREHARLGYPHLRAAGDATRASGVAYHDLTALFVESDENIYSDTCCHFTGRGYRAIARAVGEAIAESVCGA